LPLDARDSRHTSFQIKAKALDFVCKRLEGAALVRGGGGPVLFKLNDGLEAESGSSDLWLEDSNKIGGSGFVKLMMIGFEAIEM
jgi:hypothetical protein